MQTIASIILPAAMSFAPLILGLWDLTTVDGPGDQTAASAMGFLFILWPLSLCLIATALVQTLRRWRDADRLSRMVGLACFPLHLAVLAFWMLPKG